jgi:hypothetical protein
MTFDEANVGSIPLDNQYPYVRENVNAGVMVCRFCKEVALATDAPLISREAFLIAHKHPFQRVIISRTHSTTLHKCFDCGKEAHVTIHTEYRDNPYEMQIVRTCTACGEQTLGFPQEYMIVEDAKDKSRVVLVAIDAL